uniref:Putative secreted protein n=1 Tax=Anopheles darlingi TaxID=43151 RepID=A0A2M4DGH7_ANODA
MVSAWPRAVRRNLVLLVSAAEQILPAFLVADGSDGHDKFPASSRRVLVSHVDYPLILCRVYLPGVSRIRPVPPSVMGP